VSNYINLIAEKGRIVCHFVAIFKVTNKYTISRFLADIQMKKKKGHNFDINFIFICFEYDLSVGVWKCCDINLSSEKKNRKIE